MMLDVNGGIGKWKDAERTKGLQIGVDNEAFLKDLHQTPIIACSHQIEK